MDRLTAFPKARLCLQQACLWRFTFHLFLGVYRNIRPLAFVGNRIENLYVWPHFGAKHFLSRKSSWNKHAMCTRLRRWFTVLFCNTLRDEVYCAFDSAKTNPVWPFCTGLWIIQFIFNQGRVSGSIFPLLLDKCNSSGPKSSQSGKCHWGRNWPVDLMHHHPPTAAGAYSPPCYLARGSTHGSSVIQAN